MKKLLTLTISLCVALAAGAQAMYFGSARVANTAAEEPLPPVSVSDSLLAVYAAAADSIDSPFVEPLALPDLFFMPPIYDTFRFARPLTIGEQTHSGRPEMEWAEDYDVLARQMALMRHELYFGHPELVQYNLSSLPEAPQKYYATVNPADLTISVGEISTAPPADMPVLEQEKIEKKHWIRTFNASLQFSQAYVSPNWYQGGNNNLNALAQIYYNVKLNQSYHPNLLFEFTAQYKLGANNAPEDSIHAYSIQEDLLQVNTTFGVKAARRWYYSFTGQFKTQVLNSYKSNTRDLRSSFLSPGELTAGVGMTYNYANPRKTVLFDASIAPLSYNLKTCISNRINHDQYDIRPDRKTVSKFGSSCELKFQWKITYNIQFNSRVFAFTDYESFQADWENTLAMDINRFLTTQIYAHARYDTRTPREADSDWHKFQLKEIFSIGFAYKFSSI